MTPDTHPAPRAREVPTRRYRHHQAAVAAMAEYQGELRERASRLRALGWTVADQDQPEEAFCLLPAHPRRPPLVIVGGMGPLAGALAFARACARFQDSRAVILYQACAVPDRSTVILGEGSPDTPASRAMAVLLAEAVRRAVALVPARARARCIIACNSAHYFWPRVVDELRRSAPRTVEPISLVEAAVEALRRAPCRRALLLATEGARVGRVFSTPLREAGIAFDEPTPAQSRLLMRVVFEGVKALDERRAVQLGDEFFAPVARAGRTYDHVVAGCTELPHTIDLLRLRGSAAVGAFLGGVEVVDPLEEALGHA